MQLFTDLLIESNWMLDLHTYGGKLKPLTDMPDSEYICDVTICVCVCVCVCVTAPAEPVRLPRFNLGHFLKRSLKFCKLVFRRINLVK